MNSHLLKLRLSIVLTAIIISSTGCGGGGGGSTKEVSTVDTTPPIISAVRADLPSGFSFLGGNVTLSASVTDNVRVALVTAHITKDGVTVPTSNLSITSGSNYTVMYAAPANGTSKAQSYSVQIWAKDTSNNSVESSAIEFNVPPAGGDSPPSPPLL